jgi:hypothetical protein
MMPKKGDKLTSFQVIQTSESPSDAFNEVLA